jgi:iron complex transport system ATP-binding protein
MLTAENLTLSVPGKVLCRGLSLAVRSGECWAILGCNGSGKTTLLHALSGLKLPAEGKVALAGKPLCDYPRRELAREIGVLLQDESQGFWGTVLEYVLLGRHPHGDEDRDAALAALERGGVAEFAERHLATLSGGERQRVRIAQLLAQAPRLYCLDEPMQHLDLRHQAEMMALFRDLAQGGGAVVMVLHEPWWALRYCTHALLLFDDGQTLDGAAADVLTGANLEKLYGCPTIDPICV